MEQIQQLTTLMLILIPIGVAGRVVYCLIATAMDADEEQSYRVRIRNALVFFVLAETITALMLAILSYF